MLGVRKAMNLIRFIRGMWRLAAWLNSGRELVHPFLAEERAAMCGACPKGIMRRRLLTRIFAWAFRFPRTFAGRYNGTCTACGCDLPIKVWVPLTDADKPVADMPSYCWVRTERE